MEIELKYAPRNDRYARRWDKLPRCYVDIDDAIVAEELGAFPAPGVPRGDAAVDAECDRWNRAYVRIARDAAQEALAEAFGIDGVKMRWDRNAGCSMCPCSPGFVVSDERVVSALRHDPRWTAIADEAGVRPWSPVDRSLWVRVRAGGSDTVRTDEGAVRLVA